MPSVFSYHLVFLFTTFTPKLHFFYLGQPTCTYYPIGPLVFFHTYLWVLLQKTISADYVESFMERPADPCSFSSDFSPVSRKTGQRWACLAVVRVAACFV